MSGLACSLELEVPLSPDRGSPAVEEIVRGDVADGAVQAHVVVVMDEAGDGGAGLLEVSRGGGPQSIALQRLVPTLDLAVGLRVVGRGAHVGHAGDADELLEVSGDELRAVVGDDARPGVGVELASALQDALDVRLGHGLADLPVHQAAAGAIEDGAQVVEGAGEIKVGHVDMPVLVGTQRLVEAAALLGELSVPAVEATGLGQDSVGRRGAHCHHVLVEHHEGQASVALQGEAHVEVEDGLPFPVFEPVIPGHQAVVLVGLAVALLPVAELAASQLEPLAEAFGREFSLLAPGAHEVDHGISQVMGNPAAVQGSPSSFFSSTYSAEISAMTESLRASLASRCWTFSVSCFSRCEAAVPGVPSKAPAKLSKTWRCH